MTAVLWAIVWALPSVLLVMSHALRFGDRPRSDVVGIGVLLPLFLATFGAIGGATFGAVLTAAEHRRTFDELTTRRVAGWGALGGMAVPLVTLVAAAFRFQGTPPEVDALAIIALACVVFAGLGAGCSTATLALARRGTTAVA